MVRFPNDFELADPAAGWFGIHRDRRWYRLKGGCLLPRCWSSRPHRCRTFIRPESHSFGCFS